MKAPTTTSTLHKIQLLLIGLVLLLQSSFAAEIVEEPMRFHHYTSEEGLPSSYVKSITQDADGFIWAATRTAVVRFDGKNFREFPTMNKDGEEIKIFCNKLYFTPDSILLARTNDEKYFEFNAQLECFQPNELLTKLGPTSALIPSEGGYWVCQNNTVFFLDKQSGERENIATKLDAHQLPEQTLFSGLIQTSKWLAFATSGNTFWVYNQLEKDLHSFQLPDELNPANYLIQFIDSRDCAWIYSEGQGLVSFNLQTGTYSYYSSERSDDYRLPHKMVHCLTEDQRGRIWIGTEAGLAICQPETDQLKLYTNKLSEPHGLNTDPIYDAFCDRQGNVWLGTYFGGINFWSGSKNFFRIWMPGFGDWQINGNVVSCFEEDLDGNLWIGLEDKGLNKLNPKTGEMKHFSSESNGQSLSYNNLHDLLFVNDHELWIATYTGGVNVLDTRTNRFRYFNQKNVGPQFSDNIYQLEKAGDTIFLATSTGILYYPQNEKRFHQLKPEILGTLQFESIAKTGQVLWFSSHSKVYRYNLANGALDPLNRVPEMQNINFVKADSKGHVWIGDCYRGLACYKPESDEVVRYSPENGFPAHWIFSLEEGDNSWYWASSNQGLIRFSSETGESTLIDNNSGIPFNQFNYRASFTDSKGTIYFGGNDGMISFNEDENINQPDALPIAFTDFQLFNKSIHPSDKSLLSKSINQLDELELKYNQNVFTIRFSAFSYSSFGRCQYSYYLEGLETDWNHVGNRNFATYTNISPGTYTLHVRADLNDSHGNPQERQLTIVVNPPFWKTGWAYALYLLLLVLIFILVFRVGKSLEKSKAQLEIEHREKVHADEIHRVKLEFFTNISHELKTPLTLILGPLHKIMDEEKLSPAFRKRLNGIERNANRLFQLINQLLEFRKIENGKEDLKVAPASVSELTEEIANSFNNLADSREIEFKVDHPKLDSLAWIDTNKVDKMVFNLLSNAFKFTPEGGLIRLTMDVRKRNPQEPDELLDLIIQVKDSGKGIQPEMLDKVFDRFFQIEDDTAAHLGSGIGLAYVKSLVLLHKGTIRVDSQPNEGTSFTIVLPVSKEDYISTEISTSPVQYKISRDLPEFQETKQSRSDEIQLDATSTKPRILVVEDNVELLSFMKENLESKYHIITAVNGVAALEKLEEEMPELVISDIMMPEMDGMELTNKIKENLKTSHLPVILLTSKSGAKSKLEGLRSGADYYIEKPFYPNILEQNIENILATRKRLIDRFKSDDAMPVKEMAHSESDRQFIEKLTALIKDNINNPDLDVSFLIQEMRISRSLLHLKLKGLAGCSATEFIRAIRLKEAAKLISSGKCNISEAAYETGFSSPTYFTRRFREFYGKSPREYFSK